jgi:hypothetical protein
MPVIPALQRLRQEDHEFEASLGAIVRCSLQKPNQSKKKWKERKDANMTVIYSNTHSVSKLHPWPVCVNKVLLAHVHSLT